MWLTTFYYYYSFAQSAVVIPPEPPPRASLGAAGGTPSFAQERIDRNKRDVDLAAVAMWMLNEG